MTHTSAKLETPESVLEFWFVAHKDAWWKKSDAFDREIATRFGKTLEQAALGALDAWTATPKGRLALVLVLDQFSRNIYRNDSRAFEHDVQALDLTLEALASGEDQALDVVERTFLYMPLMHAENADLQRTSVAAFERALDVAPPQLARHVASGLDAAKKHAEIIERFGRFPHRNAVLDRASTAEEAEFLQEPGSSF